MSAGSLKLDAAVGTWSAQTADNALGVNQSLLSFSGFIQVNRAPSNTFTVFGNSNNPLGNAIGVSIRTADTNVYIRGTPATALASFGVPLTLGQSFHVAGTLNATSPGRAKIYINSVLKSTSTVTPGNTLANVQAIKAAIGLNGDVNLSDFAVWNGHELSAADVSALCFRTKDPTQTAVPATSWWKLGPIAPQVAGGTAAIGHASLNDAIGPNHFATITGTAGAAIYNATTLTFVPSISIVAAHVTRNGLFMLHIGTNPAFGPSVQAYPLTVTGTATFNVNGSPVTCVGPLWSSYDTGGNTRAHQNHWIAYQPYVGLNPLAIAPTDVVTYSAPANWVTALQGFSGVQTGTLENYSGGLEPGVMGYMGFNPPNILKRYKPGYLGWGVPSVTPPFRNALHGINSAGLMPLPGTKTSAADGRPLTFTAAGVIGGNVWDGTTTYMNVPRFVPAPLGVWTYTADETNIANPMTVALTGPYLAGISGPTVIPGTPDGTVERNKTWKWTVTQDKVAQRYNETLAFSWTAPSPHVDGQPFTHQNMKLYMGGDNPADPITPTNDTGFHYRKMTEVAPGLAVGVVRHLLYWPSAASARPSDIQSSDVFSCFAKPPDLTWVTSNPTYTGARLIPIYAVRPYDLSVSTRVYTHTNWRRCVPSDNLSLAPYMWKPGDFPGVTYGWMFNVATPAKQIIVEFVVADSAGNPVNHNLVTGQFLDNMNFTFNAINSLGTGTGTYAANYNIPIAVTGPNTFVGFCPVSTLNNTTAGLGKVNGLQVLPAGKTAKYQDPNVASIEHMAGVTQAEGHPPVWFGLSHCFGDDAVLSFANRIRACIPVGTEVILNISNEAFISSDTAAAIGLLSGIEGGTSGTNTTTCYDDTYGTLTLRIHQMCEIFRGVWGSDAASIKCAIQPQTAEINDTSGSLNFAHANSIPIDYIAIATYMAFDFSDEFKLLAARVYADLPESRGHPSQGGSGIRATMGQLHDLVRHHIKYYKTWNGPAGFAALHCNARDNTHYGEGGGTSGYVHAKPKLISYEGSMGDAVPWEISHVTKTMRTGMTHDFVYHPEYYQTAMAIMQFHQQPGPNGQEGFYTAAANNLVGARTFAGVFFTCPDGNDNEGTTIWGHHSWYGQPVGYGLTNKYWADIAPFNGDRHNHDFENEAIFPQAVKDWLIAGSDAAVFSVAPTSVASSQPSITLTLAGSNTHWTDDSTIAITNSITGTTNVAFGSWDSTSETAAILTVSTGDAAGTWRVTVDGVQSPPITQAASVIPSYGVTPNSVSASQTGVVLTLTGVNTNWVTSSTRTVTNSVSGSTTVTLGTWTRISATSATLAVNTGLGSGTWRLVIDGVNSPILNFAPAVVQSFTVAPSTVASNQGSIALALVGTNTNWTTGSSVSITNSISGVTTAAVGSWNRTSATAATLVIATGTAAGGTFKVTVDGIDSPILTQQATLIQSFAVTPTYVAENASVTLELVGTNTNWTAGSSIAVINGVSGTTSITPGLWTVTTPTSATLAVGSGTGYGTWRIMVDGVSSTELLFGAPPPPVTERPRWAEPPLRRVAR